MDPVLKLFRSKLKVVNIGLEHFYRELKRQNIDVAHVVWQPRPKLEKDLEEILSKIM
ncbi:MAG: fdrA domain protein [Thermoprotei archaeon]|nr:MAG: fdrA domain protein [Thermoprotei archaeon]